MNVFTRGFGIFCVLACAVQSASAAVIIDKFAIGGTTVTSTGSAVTSRTDTSSSPQHVLGDEREITVHAFMGQISVHVDEQKIDPNTGVPYPYPVDANVLLSSNSAGSQGFAQFNYDGPLSSGLGGLDLTTSLYDSGPGQYIMVYDVISSLSDATLAITLTDADGNSRTQQAWLGGNLVDPTDFILPLSYFTDHSIDTEHIDSIIFEVQSLSGIESKPAGYVQAASLAVVNDPYATPPSILQYNQDNVINGEVFALPEPSGFVVWSVLSGFSLAAMAWKRRPRA